MTLMCGSDLYANEVCYVNIIDKKLYPTVFTLKENEIEKLAPYYIALSDFKINDMAKVKGKKLYKL